MRISPHRATLIAIGFSAITACNTGTNRNSSNSKSNGKVVLTHAPLSALIDTILRETASILPDTLIGTADTFHRQIDSVAGVILSKQECIDNPVKKIVEIKKFVFNTRQIKPSPSLNKLQSVFPHLAFNKKQGSCLSISLIFLLLGEKLNLPLYGVFAPGHFFVRYDDGKIRLNIETLRYGEFMSDSWYKERYGIADTTLYDLSSPDIASILASIRYNLGNFYLSSNWPDLSIQQYNQALQLNPDYLEAQGNRAVALDASGNPDAALRILLDLKKKYPELVYLRKNLAALYLKRKFYRKAIVEYQYALTRAPSDTEVLYGLGVSCYYSKQIEKARAVLTELCRICPDHHEAQYLLSNLNPAIP